jgi:poly(U)-specific endoribonuclease
VEITGFHNWIRIYMEEKANHFNYLGFIKPKRRGLRYDMPDEYEQVISMQFEWKGAKKLVSTSMIGTSPGMSDTFFFFKYNHH